jgi:hypothetical protein
MKYFCRSAAATRFSVRKRVVDVGARIDAQRRWRKVQSAQGRRAQVAPFQDQRGA